MSSPNVVVGSPLPEGLLLPELIVTRRTRTQSMSGRIETNVKEGQVKFFCRSKGHGFIDVEVKFYFKPLISDLSYCLNFRESIRCSCTSPTLRENTFPEKETPSSSGCARCRQSLISFRPFTFR